MVSPSQVETMIKNARQHRIARRQLLLTEARDRAKAQTQPDVFVRAHIDALETDMQSLQAAIDQSRERTMADCIRPTLAGTKRREHSCGFAPNEASRRLRRSAAIQDMECNGSAAKSPDAACKRNDPADHAERRCCAVADGNSQF